MADEKGKGISPEEEIAQYQDILAKDPTSRVFARLAEAHRKAGQLEYAIAVSREGLKNHPGYTAGEVVLARSLFDAGKPDEARAEIARVVAAAPDNLTAQKLLAQIAVRLNDGPSAEKAYRMVQLLDPSDEEARNYLAAADTGSPDATPPPAYDTPPVESAPPPAEPPVTESPIEEAAAPAAQTSEEGLPPGLTLEEDQPPAAEEPAAEAEAAPPPVSDEPVFDLGEMEAAAEEEAPEPEAPAEESPFEIFTKEPRHEPLPPEGGEEKSEPFAEIEFPGDEPSDIEPPREEPTAVMGEMPLVEAEEVTELVIDDVEPVMEEPPAAVEEPTAALEEMPLVEAEEVTELVLDEPVVEEPPAAVEEPAATLEEMPLVEAEEVADLVIDDVAPVMEEPLPEVEEVAELVMDEPEAEEAPAPAAEAALPAEPAESLDAFDVEGAEDRRAGKDPSPEGVFNTETLANLYVTQGFYGKAADVYRQMLTDRPGDTHLMQKLEEVLALEKMQTPSVHEDTVPVAAAAPREAGIGAESPVIEELQRLLAKLKERPR